MAGGGTTSIQESLKGLEERLGASFNAKLAQVYQSSGPASGATLQRQDFIAAARRLPDGDPWKEKVIKELQLDARKEETPQQ